MSDATRVAATAERAARAGGVVARERFRESLAVETKANKNDFVTETDRDAQRQVLATIGQAHPGATVVSEEESLPPKTDVELAAAVPESGRAWIVDPIDGTANYVREMRFWATSVVAVESGEPVAAATHLPALEDTYTADSDAASRNGASMSVSDRADPETFAVGLLGRWARDESDRIAALLSETTQRFGDTRRMGCMQGVLALVAAGSLEGALMPTTPHPWDAVAGVHLVRRAGGTATDIAGERWSHDSEGLVVSNGRAHDQLVAAVRAAVDE